MQKKHICLASSLLLRIILNFNIILNKINKLNLTNKLIKLIFFTIIFTGCTEKIDLELDESYARLVVDGEVTNEKKAHQVKLSMTSSFLGETHDPPVTGANITISSATTTFNLQESQSEPGLYFTNPDIQGIPGELYQLDIELPVEVNGQKHYSASSMMFPVAPIDSIGLKYDDRWDVWEVQCYALDPPTIDFYMFEILKNSIMVNDTLSDKMVVADKLYNGQYTNGIGVGWLDPEKPNEQLHNGDTVTLRMSGITEEYAYFIWEVQRESGYQNPMFGGPPANVTGNISDGAIGFFAAYSVEYGSMVYEE